LQSVRIIDNSVAADGKFVGGEKYGPWVV